MPLASMQAVGRLSPAVWYPGYASRLSLPIDTPLRNAPSRPRRRRWRLVQADAEALIRDHGTEAYGEARRPRRGMRIGRGDNSAAFSFLWRYARQYLTRLTRTNCVTFDTRAKCSLTALDSFSTKDFYLPGSNRASAS